MIQLKELYEVIPLLIIAFSATFILLIEAFYRKGEDAVFGFSLLAVISAIAASMFQVGHEVIVFNQFLRITGMSVTFSVIMLISIAITIIASKSYLEKENINFSEYYSLLLFALLGMMLMVMANDILIIFIGLEIMSISFYVLAGFLRRRPKSNESALKYFLLGAFMTGFILYGIALIYGASGTTNLTMLYANKTALKQFIFIVGLGLFTIGFMFKIGVFPFQMWVPDVYDGAPTVVSGMLSTAGKIAAVGTLLPLMLTLNIIDFKLVFAVASVATMLYGNVIALAQKNIKRLLAYSSIASAGYIFVGLSAMNKTAMTGITFYLIAYTFMQLGAFIIVSILEKRDDGSRDYKNVDLDFYKGLGKRNPWTAAFLTIFLFSLAGIPPFAGFWGKYYLFYAAIEAKMIWLAVIGILLSLIGVYYYLKIIVYMWFSDATGEVAEEAIHVPATAALASIMAVIGTILFGLIPDLFFRLFKMPV